MSGAVGRAAAVAEGIGIMLKYETDPGIDAQHDVIYCGATPPGAMSDEDRKRLVRLKWGWDLALDCWAIFT